MQEDGSITPELAYEAGKAPLQLVAYEREQRDTGYYFLDHINRETKSLPGVIALTASSATVRSTIHPQLQRAAEAALQEGLARYELSTGRVQFSGAEANLGTAVQRIQSNPQASKANPAWQLALHARTAPALRRASASGRGRPERPRRHQDRPRGRTCAAAERRDRRGAP